MLLLLVRYQLKQPTESTQEEEQVTRSSSEPAAAPKYASVRFLVHAKSARVFHTHVANCSCSRTPKETTTRDPTTLVYNSVCRSSRSPLQQPARHWRSRSSKTSCYDLAPWYQRVLIEGPSSFAVPLSLPSLSPFSFFFFLSLHPSCTQ